MDPRQQVLDDAVAAGDVPFAVAITATADGPTWSGAAGEAAPGRAAAEDTVLRIFSMTKAVGSTAAMILIDRGQLSMDTPVAEILPGFADLPVLDGFDGDTPRLRPQQTTATVRHLATHTSGLEYEFWNPDIPRWMEATGHTTILSGTRASLNYALAFDPGTRWGYGPGIDWLGQVVEAVDGRRIDAFCRDEIFTPLAMPDTDVEVRPDMATRLAAVKARGEDGRLADFDLAPPANPEVYGMGHCLYSTPRDYLRFLRMFLGRGALDGTRVLSEAAVAEMLASQSGPLEIPKMISVVPPVSADVELFPGLPKSHSFGFLRVDADVPGMRRAGAQGWAGVLNSHYWFDPASDLAAVLVTQSLPFLEPRFLDTYQKFETAAYAA